MNSLIVMKHLLLWLHWPKKNAKKNMGKIVIVGA